MLDVNTKDAGLVSAEWGRWRRCHQPGGRRVTHREPVRMIPRVLLMESLQMLV